MVFNALYKKLIWNECKVLGKLFGQTMNESITELKTTPNVIREGKAEILEPPGRKVFYNPVQEFNRDLSVLSLQVFSKELQQEHEKNGCNSSMSFRILEALSATGLRSIRYAKEVPNVSQVIANDISDVAVKNMTENVKHNQVENLVHVSHSNAVSLMFDHNRLFDRVHVVDLDPYGSPSQFLDSAVQCILDGGMLLVTCTDMTILCGLFPETCYVKYGAVSLRSPAHHEMAIRIILQNIQSHASRYKRYIIPVLSVSIDFYIRIFVKIYTSAAACKHATSNLAMVYYCTGCEATTLQPLGVTLKNEKDNSVKHSLPRVPPVGMKCSFCGGNHNMGGPIWSGPIHNQNFVNQMLISKEINELGTSKRVIGILSMIREELDVPLYYDASKLASTLKMSSIPIMKIRSAILNANYRVSFSHACKQSIKTDAPMSFIWDIFKKWMEDNSIKLKNLQPSSPAYNILKQPIQNEIDFSLRPDANPLSREMKLSRFPENPMPFWGPGTKSTTTCLVENAKRARNQNRKKSKELSISYEKSSKEMKLDDNTKNDL